MKDQHYDILSTIMELIGKYALGFIPRGRIQNNMTAGFLAFVLSGASFIYIDHF